MEYEGDRPLRVDAVVLSSQHSEDVSTEQIRQDLAEKIVKRVVPDELFDDNTKILHQSYRALRYWRTPW